MNWNIKGILELIRAGHTIICIDDGNTIRVGELFYNDDDYISVRLNKGGALNIYDDEIYDYEEIDNEILSIQIV